MPSISGLNSNGLNFSGLATGIDTAKIIDGLTSINRGRIATFEAKKDAVALKQSTFSALQSKLFDLQSKLTSLSRSVSGSFDARKATSSDSDALAATASTSATAGTYNLTVVSLARAQQTASAGFADPNARIKEGTIGLRVGAGTEVSVTIDSRNNTLSGLADAINAAGGDVRAAVVNDGTASPYKLVLTSNKTGEDNAIQVSGSLSGGTGAAVNPLATTIQAAADAEVRLGTGPGALTVTSATNQLHSLIPGVSLDLKEADPAKSVVVTVSNDTASASKAVQDFVASFNAVVEFIDQRDDFNRETQQAGVLLGSRDAASLQNDLNSALTTAVSGVKAEMNRLSAVGISFTDKGKLEVNAAKLDQALNGQVAGVSLADVKRLFALTGSSDNPGVSFVLGTEKTKPTGPAPYQVNVTSAATRALLTATNALGGTVTISPPDTALMIKLNGLAAVGITIEPGTYTPDQVAALLQQKINTNPAFNGNLVSVGLTPDNKLAVTSQQYGAASKVEVTGGSALASLGFAGTETAVGADVAGTFVVNGQAEPATGSGQVLTGSAGNANTDGLQVRAALGAAGAANLTVTQGFASRLNSVLTKYLDTTNGRLVALDKGYKAEIEAIDETIGRQNDLMTEKNEQLARRFAAMEKAVSNLKGLQSQLTALIPTLTANSR